MLYFFAGKAVVVLSHGLTKERAVPPREIAQAIERKKRVEADFEQFTSDRSNGMPPKKKFHSNASKFLYNRFIAGDGERDEEYEEEVINADIARKIYDLRTKAGLTQQELAARVGTTKSAICRLEDANYEGHSLSMLQAHRRGTR